VDSVGRERVYSDRGRGRGGCNSPPWVLIDTLDPGTAAAPTSRLYPEKRGTKQRAATGSADRETAREARPGKKIGLVDRVGPAASWRARARGSTARARLLQYGAARRAAPARRAPLRRARRVARARPMGSHARYAAYYSNGGNRRPHRALERGKNRSPIGSNGGRKLRFFWYALPAPRSIRAKRVPDPRPIVQRPLAGPQPPSIARAARALAERERARPPPRRDRVRRVLRR
jgi:hypothetical protein